MSRDILVEEENSSKEIFAAPQRAQGQFSNVTFKKTGSSS
jgi:hypothetical protein